MTGIPEVVNPPHPTEVWSLELPGRYHLNRLAGFSRADPQGCTDPLEIPTPAQFATMLNALNTELASDGVFEVVALENGCARLTQWRHRGNVLRWELNRFWNGKWVRAVSWDFDPGVKRPSTITRYGMQAPLDRFGEWSGDEVHQKSFVRVDAPPSSEYRYLHYRGTATLFATEPGAPPRRISSNTTTRYCRTGGTDPCDDPERAAHRSFEASSEKQPRPL